MDSALKFEVVRLPNNQGHGNARRICLDKCSYDYVALMDADDISVPDRFEKQIKCFENYEGLSVVGGQIQEFIGSIDNIVGVRVVPIEDKDIKIFLKKRCPFNHVSVMFRKADVRLAGGYIDWYCEEDYYLWIRMYQNGMSFRNIDENLVFVRVGEEMYQRRGGWRYFKSEARLQIYMLKQEIIGLCRFIYNIAIRFVIQVAIPNKLRGYVFKLIRKKPSTDFVSKGIDSTVLSTLSNKLVSKTPAISFSVSMCVFKNDDPEHFNQAIASIIHQTVQPTEIVLVVDGPIPDSIEMIISKYQDSLCSE